MIKSIFKTLVTYRTLTVAWQTQTQLVSRINVANYTLLVGKYRPYLLQDLSLSRRSFLSHFGCSLLQSYFIYNSVRSFSTIEGNNQNTKLVGLFSSSYSAVNDTITNPNISLMEKQLKIEEILRNYWKSEFYDIISNKRSLDNDDVGMKVIIRYLKTSLNYEVYMRKDPRYSLGWHIKPVYCSTQGGINSWIILMSLSTLLSTTRIKMAVIALEI